MLQRVLCVAIVLMVGALWAQQTYLSNDKVQFKAGAFWSTSVDNNTYVRASHKIQLANGIIVDDLVSSSNSNFDAIMLGAIVAFACPENQIPTGWMVCDGRAIDRVQYANLFTAIGTTWGSGNGHSSFNIPDLRGRFVRGADNIGGTAKGIDSGRVLGTYQSYSTALPSVVNGDFTISNSSDGTHSHSFNDYRCSYQDGSDAVWGNSPIDSYPYDEELQPYSNPLVRTSSANPAHSHSLTMDSGWDTETRPLNMALVYAIKY